MVKTILFLLIIFNALMVQAEPNFVQTESSFVQAESSFVQAESSFVQAESSFVQAESKNILFKLYKEFISSADGDRCGMFPSCSNYAEQTFKKHGFFMGWIMTCDRLIRCGGDETSLSIQFNEQYKPINEKYKPNMRYTSMKKLLILDSVEANDFWWNFDTFSN